MRSSGLHAGGLQDGARRAARPWVESLARAGYAAKGVLYLTIGALAALLAFGESGGRATDSHGALRALREQPFGQVLLIVMGVGLIGHALWRTVQGTLDPEGEVRSAERPLAKRASFLLRAVLHAALAVFAIKLALDAPTSRGGGARSLSAQVMSWEPLGVWLVALAGVIILGFGLAQVGKALKGEVGTELGLRNLSARAARLVRGFGKFGTLARGAVLGIIGGFIVYAALTFDPSQAKGLGETLAWLRRQSFGDVLLAVTAFGLMAYGVYQLVVARYRVIRAT